MSYHNTASIPVKTDAGARLTDFDDKSTAPSKSPVSDETRVNSNPGAEQRSRRKSAAQASAYPGGPAAFQSEQSVNAVGGLAIPEPPQDARQHNRHGRVEEVDAFCGLL